MHVDVCDTLKQATTMAGAQGMGYVAPGITLQFPDLLAFGLGAAATTLLPSFVFFVSLLCVELFNNQQGMLLELQILCQRKHA